MPKEKTWALALAPWTEEQRAALRAKGDDRRLVARYALRVDARCVPPHACKLEAFFTFEEAKRPGWLSDNVLPGKWVPTAAPTTAEGWRALFSQYDEGDDHTKKRGRPTKRSKLGDAEALLQPVVAATSSNPTALPAAPLLPLASPSESTAAGDVAYDY